MNERRPADDRRQRTSRSDLVLVALAAAPFYLNDLLFIASRTVEQWLFADYGSKVLGLALLLAFAPLRAAVRASLALRRPWPEAAGWAVLATIAIVGLDQGTTWLKREFGESLPWAALFDYPAIEDPVLRATDLTLGLFLTALSEEFLFRGVLGVVGARYVANRILLSILAALAFALIHWAQGAFDLAFTFAAGLILMALYWRTGSTIPGIVVHYVVNLVSFA